MKKVLCASGIATITLLLLFLTGWAGMDDTVKETLRRGNEQYESTYYMEALSLYEAGLEASPENKALNYNAAQTAYLLGEYEKALEYYGKSEDVVKKFLNTGNICFRAGDAAEDMNEKSQFYNQALLIYGEGIVKYPQDVPLKYNFEFVREKLEELLEDMEQENQEQENQEQENQEQEQQDSEQDENGEGENQESQEQESQDSENSQGDDSQEEEEAEENQEQNSQQEEESGDEQQEGYSQEEGEETPDQEAIERILQMLENQEEQSLKNNQEVVGGNEGKNGW